MALLHWFEIPVEDMQRAVEFYNTVLDIEISVLDMRAEMGSVLGIFPSEAGDTPGGALVENQQYGYVPSQQGSLVYFSLGERDLNSALDRVASSGGAVLVPKTAMGENGFSAWIQDSEGNKVGLFSRV